MMMTIRVLLVPAMMLALTAWGQEKMSYVPEIHGTVRAKYEYEPQIGKGRFEVRNARVSVEGRVLPVVRYKAEIDLSDEGQIKMLDAYVRYQPKDWLKFTAGQMRVPFTIDAHRSPHLQYFANRSFIAKQVGNVRDVGVSAGWTSGWRIPVTLQGGVFNGSGLTNQKNFWTSGLNYSVKAEAVMCGCVTATISMQKASAEDTDEYMYDVGGYWERGRWHVEAEYLRKHYDDGAFRPVNAVDVFGAYRHPIGRGLKAVSILGRYDYMSDHSKGKKDESGVLKADDAERHRATAGVTLSFGSARLQADLRINYEQYFYRHGVTPGISDRNKIVAEVVCHF